MALLSRSRYVLTALAPRRLIVPVRLFHEISNTTSQRLAVVRTSVSARCASSSTSSSSGGGSSTTSSSGNDTPSGGLTNRTGARKPDKPKGAMTWETVGIAAALITALLVLLKIGKDKKREELEKNKIMSMGKAAIGGEFELTNQNNKRVSSKDFLGKWILVYFGFTHCPDICPEELEKMSAVVKAVDEKKGTDFLQPLFISVDPERDSPQNIAKYLADFSPRLLGLTGSVDDIKDVCKKFRIYFSAGPKQSDNDYIVDHSIIMYLLNPKGEFVDYFGQNKTQKDILNALFFHVESYNMAEKMNK